MLAGDPGSFEKARLDPDLSPRRVGNPLGFTIGRGRVDEVGPKFGHVDFGRGQPGKLRLEVEPILRHLQAIQHGGLFDRFFDRV